MEAAGGGERAVFVVAFGGVGADPIVDEGVGRAGIEAAPCVFMEPCEVADAAQVQDAQAFVVRAAGAVVAGRKRCALAASGYVCASEIVDDGAACERGEAGGVAGLPGPFLVRFVGVWPWKPMRATASGGVPVAARRRWTAVA